MLKNEKSDCGVKIVLLEDLDCEACVSLKTGFSEEIKDGIISTISISSEEGLSLLHQLDAAGGEKGELSVPRLLVIDCNNTIFADITPTQEEVNGV